MLYLPESRPSYLSLALFFYHRNQVNGTLQDFSNIHRNNLALWLDGETALYYAGFLRQQSYPMRPQPNLNSPRSILSLIPPPHFNEDGLAEVYASSSAVNPAGTLNVFGINGFARSIFGLTGATIRNALLEGQQESNGFIAFPTQPGDGFDQGNRRIAFIVDIRSRALQALARTRGGYVISFPEPSETVTKVARGPGKNR